MQRVHKQGRTIFVTALAELAAVGLARADSTPQASEHETTTVAPLASSGNCGVERCSVKTGADHHAGLIDLSQSVPQTIAYLTNLPDPSSLPPTSCVQHTETAEYVVDATLIKSKLEGDSDYHLVLTDSQGRTMVAEIPDPACVGSISPFKAAITNARAEFNAKYTATTSFKTTSIPIEIHGVGFFDFDHGQTGVAPNAIELHPALDDASTTMI